MFRIVHDVETNEIIEIELTDAEKKAIELDKEPPNPPKSVTLDEKLSSIGLNISTLKEALEL